MSQDQQHDRQLGAEAIGVGLADRYRPILAAPLPPAMERLLMRLASLRTG
jgi:hypothetical protein